MSAFHIKRKKSRVRMPSNPLPKRNRREALVRRIAGSIKGQLDLDKAMLMYPPYMQKAWLAELRPYLKFEPRED